MGCGDMQDKFSQLFLSNGVKLMLYVNTKKEVCWIQFFKINGLHNSLHGIRNVHNTNNNVSTTRLIVFRYVVNIKLCNYTLHPLIN